MYKILIRVKRFFKKFLKVKAETRQTLSTRTSSKINKYLMLMLVACLIALLYPAEDLFFPLDYPRKGEIAREDIIATFQFTIAKSRNELRDEKNAAANAIPIIIEYDTARADAELNRFDRFMVMVDSTANIIKSFKQTGEQTRVEEDILIDSLSRNITALYPSINPGSIVELLRRGNIESAKVIIHDILKNTIYFSGVLTDINTLPDVKNRSVIVRIGKRETFLIRDRLLDLSKAYVTFLAELNNRSLHSSFDVDNYYNIGRRFIVPNLTLNTQEMLTRREIATNEISPISEMISVGDVIVRAGSRISPRQGRILEEMYRQKESVSEKENWFRPYLPIMARLVLILVAFAMLYMYLFNFHNRIYTSNQKLLALFVVYGLDLILIYLLGNRLNLSIYAYPIVIFSILITVLFDAEVGTFNVFILAMLLGVLHRFNFSIVIITMIAGVISCYTIQGVRHRLKFFKAIVYLAITYISLVFILESFKVSPTEEILKLTGYAVANAFISPILAMGILPVFESVFGFTTNVTLLELSDLNRPLLKRLAMEAPGTYHHSILVGNLAESAALAIGANPLLARVGAYYHDIGKMEIPEYFVENQLGIKSKHDSLTPSMSAIILASHLKKGRVIGEEADLPDEILNFIEEHHGTMLMSYFYNKAKEMGIDEPSIEEYRYPGPKPQIRETAIVMLADSVEAASRTLADPKPARLRNLVQNIINDRFQSGELEECPLTLKDLAEIRESFTQILIGVFHHRIEYPDKEDEK
jgi:putative nucleotidyltransferase with HDIG domain